MIGAVTRLLIFDARSWLPEMILQHLKGIHAPCLSHAFTIADDGFMAPV